MCNCVVVCWSVLFSVAVVVDVCCLCVDIRCSLFLGCCLLFVVVGRCLKLLFVRCVLFVVCCLFIVRCL